MDLLLHIGTEKTGSSSFQAWAAHHRDALRANGICYSRTLGRTAHNDIALWIHDSFTGQRDQVRRGIENEDDWQTFKAALPRTLAREVAEARKAGCHSFVISCELLHSRMTHDAHVAAIHDLLAPLFDTMTVLCWLRPQIDMAVSHLSTISRTHKRVSRDSLLHVRPEAPYYNYDTLEQRWSAQFGADAIQLFPYQRGPGPRQLLLDRFGLDADAFPDLPRRNTARDIRTIQMANCAISPIFSEGPAAVDFMRGFLDDLPCTQPPDPGADLAHEKQAAFTDCNTRLVQRRSDLTMEDLTPDPDRYTGTGNLHLLDPNDPMAAHYADMLVLASRREAALDLRHKLLRAEAQLANGKQDDARRLLALAEKLSTRLPAFQTDANMQGQRRKLRTLKKALKDGS